MATNDEILAGMIMAAKAERDAGFEGWSSPSEKYIEACDRLVNEGLAEKTVNPLFDDEMYYRPTAEGERRCQIKISRVS